MMKKYKTVFIVSGCLLAVTACGNFDNNINWTQENNEIIEVQKNETEDALETDTDRYDEEETETEEAPEVQPEWEVFHFVDVYGEEYETVINPAVPKHDYFRESFICNDGIMTYADDENYDYRLGIDVSHHQGKIDWQQVRDAGYEFAFIRIGYRGYGKEGKICPDKEFENYIKGARAVGMDVGVYFFAQAVNETEAKEEAQFVLERLSGYELQLPVVYDPESILDAPARTDDVSGEQFTANTKAFCEMIEDAGYEAMIYSNMLWEAYELDLSQLSDYEIWYADYDPFPQTPYHFVFWQYTNTGSVPGIAGDADLDIQLIKRGKY